MATGKVKWFNEDKGYGFIVPDDGGADVFVHIRALEKSGMGAVEEGQRVEFDAQASRKEGKFEAVNIRHVQAKAA